MVYFSNIPRSTLTVSIVVVTRRKRTSTPFEGMYSLIFISSLTPPTDNSQCCSAPALIPSNEISSKFPLLLSSQWNLKMSVYLVYCWVRYKLAGGIESTLHSLRTLAFLIRWLSFSNWQNCFSEGPGRTTNKCSKWLDLTCIVKSTASADWINFEF